MQHLKFNYPQVTAGLGISTQYATFDFETYSPVGFKWNAEKNKWSSPQGNKRGLPLVGSTVYAEHPDTEVLSLAYDIGTGIQLWKPGQHLPQDLFQYIKAGGYVEAWNCMFEYLIWNKVCTRRYGFPTLSYSQLFDAMAKARAFGLPGSLDKAGEVLDITNKKDKRGKLLLQKFSVPRNPTKTNLNTRVYAHNDILGFEQLLEYNKQDVRAEQEISTSIPDLSEFELEFWRCDQAINLRGVKIDTESVQACIKFIEMLYKDQNNKLYKLTQGKVGSVFEIKKLLNWINSQQNQIKFKTLNSETVEKCLNENFLPNHVCKVLHIRQSLSSASIKKLYAMNLQMAEDNRLHNLFIYHSARTGRAAGAGPQPQNLPNHAIACLQCECFAYFTGTCHRCGNSVYPEDPRLGRGKQKGGGIPVKWDIEKISYALETFNTQPYENLLMRWHDPLDVISACLRSLFISSSGHDLICSDYSAIEAVVLAAIAQEQWRLDVFNSHGKIYEMSASKITGIPFEEFESYYLKNKEHHPLRKKVGKVAELASGYQGWINAWKQFGADEFFNDEEIKQSILAWREASPNIVKLWKNLEDCALKATMHPNTIYEYNSIRYLNYQNILYCKLLSGRYLTYHNPIVAQNPTREGLQLSFETWNTNPKNGVTGWIRIPTYGGRLTENVVQATARDILAHAIINLEKNKYPVVLHIHDEIVSEIPENYGSLEEFEKIMSTMPQWAKNWPIFAKGGWRGKRYRK